MDSLLVVVALVSLALATGMSLVAWKLLRDNQRRSAERADALAEVALGDEAIWRPGTEMRRTVENRPDPLVIAAVIIVMGGGVGAVYALKATNAPATEEMADSNGRSIELLSLEYNADVAGVFSVTGAVAAAENHAMSAGVVAVVYLFDEDGKFFTSGQAAIEANDVVGPPGSFTVRIPTTVAVSRYRIGFRNGRGAVVLHVDRRQDRGVTGS